MRHRERRHGLAARPFSHVVHGHPRSLAQTPTPRRRQRHTQAAQTPRRQHRPRSPRTNRYALIICLRYHSAPCIVSKHTSLQRNRRSHGRNRNYPRRRRGHSHEVEPLQGFAQDPGQAHGSVDRRRHHQGRLQPRRGRHRQPCRRDARPHRRRLRQQRHQGRVRRADRAPGHRPRREGHARGLRHR